MARCKVPRVAEWKSTWLGPKVSCMPTSHWKRSGWDSCEPTARMSGRWSRPSGRRRQLSSEGGGCKEISNCKNFWQSGIVYWWNFFYERLFYKFMQCVTNNLKVLTWPFIFQVRMQILSSRVGKTRSNSRAPSNDVAAIRPLRKFLRNHPV